MPVIDAVTNAGWESVAGKSSISSCSFEIDSFGRVTINSAYWFTSLSICIVPSNNSTILWQIAIPSPLREESPFIAFSSILSRILYLLNMSSLSSFLMPLPVL